MDREQAIKIIKDCKEKSFKRTLYTLNEYYEAVDMAIEALEQEPDAIHNEREQAYMKGYEVASKRFRTELCEDAISREAVKEMLAKYHLGESRIAEELNELPSIQRTSNANKKHVENTLEDAISRQAAINIVRCDALSAAIIYGRTEEGMSARKAIVNGLKRLPSVSTEETGHWSRKTKVDAYDIAGVKTWGIKCQCDRCTFTTIVVEDFGYYKYCPNCGAKMGVEE